VFKPENIGGRMSIDDKATGHEGYTYEQYGYGQDRHADREYTE